ncbi:3-oxoacyl-ACP synthase III family protein [Desulfonatronum thioautotrophicum]|uniref:3-oxoacyl-ACP synthase III family protein n=1 Tax=Desulfonatronum thioautotrophicum TaxID=617001 RepID=UPI0005EAD9FD|nr:ketoacyl-ACP synthase III [Desulfonatronum thioautotrophicum]
MGTSIRGIEYYLPEKIVDNIQLEKEFANWSADKIEQKVGIRERHIAAENETALDLAVCAGEKILADYDPKKIDFVLFCTQSPDYFLPPNACILQDRLQLSTSVGAFDFNLACSGYVYGLALAKSLIGSGLARNILLITSETYSKHIHEKDQANRTIFGDGASATILEHSDIEKIGAFSLGTDGRGYDKLIVPCGGMRKRALADPECIEDGSGSCRTENNLHMNGPDIFNFTIEVVPKVVDDVLKKNGHGLDDVDYVVFHQANKYMLEYLRKKIKIDPNKFYLNILNTGNTVSSSIPIALKNCFDEDIVKTGDKVLLLGFGAGLSWGGTVIEI